MESSNACSWNTTANIVGVDTFTTILLIVGVIALLIAVTSFKSGMG